ncbi:response regulator [Natronococcus occultus]|uniref:Response regulator with CheY-like receiver domain and winged-helix DNA-binding domain n=1 Tax=Natronococcus occultus SP4 TaxID=694430 RepID=L0K180_9EURY|nr:response regulator [Natronococcus occultus]AGB37868.1 response regulator with CheY-like receiver domain and winged-helix DNA-binding domain [Natronococcus occultus SP4]
MGTVTASESTNILLVEDNPGDVTLVREAFDEVADDVRIDTVPDGDEAMRVLSERRETGTLPDILLLDLNVPGMHGLELLESLQKSPELTAIPVIVLTCSDDETDIAESYNRRANAYLTKPDSSDGFVSLAQAVDEFWLRTAKLPTAPAV